MDTIHVNKISLSKCDVTINLYRKPSLRVNKKKLKKNTLGNRGSNDLNFVIQELKSPRNDKYDHICKEHVPCDVVEDNIVEDAEIEEEEEQNDIIKEEAEAEEEDEADAEEEEAEAETEEEEDKKKQSTPVQIDSSKKNAKMEEDEAEDEDEDEEEEDEVYIKKINGKNYYVTGDTDGDIYAVDEDEEVGDLVGKIKKGKYIFN